MWIVDDSRTEQLITERSLGASYSYVRFDDGAEVIEHVGAGSELPDVLLLDWMMPGIGGDEVCRFLRTQDATKDLPIIILTSRMATADVVHGLSIGANDYVPRPFAPEELRARVEAVLRAKELADVASRERIRISAVNRLGHKLFAAGNSVDQIVEELLATLVASLCDGCSIELLQPHEPALNRARHYLLTTSAEIASSSDVVVVVPFPDLVTVHGAVTVMRDMGSVAFDDDDLATIRTCVAYAAVGIERVLRRESERLANARLEAVLAHAPSGIVVTDASGALTLTNSSAVRMIPGIEQAGDIADVYALADWSMLGGAPISRELWLRATGPSGSLRTIDVKMQIRDQPSRTLSVSTVPFTTGGAVVGAVTTIEDITAARQVSVERERIAKFQEQMLAIVGHDLRNPLGAVLMGADAVELNGTNSEQVHKNTGRIRRAGLRMQGIIEQLLDVTRARLGEGIPLNARQVSLLPVVRGVLEELSAAHPKATFELTGQEDVDGVWDPDRLSQVISNLASNAMHYGRPSTPIVVDVRTSEAGAMITITNAIRDQPIDPAKLAVLFDPYQRGRDGVNNSQGLGLGLYIVSEIVRSHRGTIVAASTVDGTVFRIELPRQLLVT